MTGGWDLDVTGSVMILICNLSSFSICYSDGAKKDSELTED